MATQRLLALANNRTTEIIPLTVSAGASSAGQPVALNNAGVLDSTLMPPGLGADVATMTASEAIAAGAWINVWSNSGAFAIRNADGTTAGKQCDGYVLSALASGASGTAYFGGVNNAVSGQSPGPVFLSDTAVGMGAATGATAAGHIFQQVGTALSATAVQFEKHDPITRA